MAQFTPGPWQRDGLSLIIGQNTPHEEYRVLARIQHGSRSIGNASLIAAAPELYAALQNIAGRNNVAEMRALAERALAKARDE